MLLSTELCYHPCSGIMRPMALSTELCYLYMGMLLSTELCYCPCYPPDPCYSPQSYVIVHMGMLLSILWYSQTHVIIHRAMLLSTAVCCRPQTYVIIHVVIVHRATVCYLHRGMLKSTELCYRLCGGFLRPMLLST